MIFSKPKLTDELNYIKMIFLKKGYFEDMIITTIRYKCMQFSAKRKFGPESCPVNLKLLWTGNAAMQLLEQIKRSVIWCFISVKLQVILKSDVLFPQSQR